MIWLLVFLLPSQFCAHGVKSFVGSGGIVVTSQYDTGEAMSYARVRILAPGAKLPFQSGRTDRNGRFCFFPDVAGDWEMVVNDEMGHRPEVNVPGDKAMKLKTDQRGGKAKSFLQNPFLSFLLISQYVMIVYVKY